MIEKKEVPGKKPADRTSIAVKSFVPANKLSTDPAEDAIRYLKKIHKMAHYNPKKRRWECAACQKHGKRGVDARDLAQQVCKPNPMSRLRDLERSA